MDSGSYSVDPTSFLVFVALAAPIFGLVKYWAKMSARNQVAAEYRDGFNCRILVDKVNLCKFTAARVECGAAYRGLNI